MSICTDCKFRCFPSNSKIFRSLKIVFQSSWLNLLLIFFPLGCFSHLFNWLAAFTFFFNCLAIIPLASLLSLATDNISDKYGQTVGGLLSATFGNAVELIISIAALSSGQIRIVQASMLGS